MSKNSLREETNCLNCGHPVEKRYCPDCGQENTESRQTFHHLFRHFFEDLTHYDRSFWKTIFTLFFKPAKLTRAYMAGKRLSYLAPIRLCIFISFVTFLMISFFPNDSVAETQKPKGEAAAANGIPSIDSLHIEEKSIDGLTEIGILSQENNDTIKKILTDTDTINPKGLISLGYKDVKELDSLQKNAPESVKANPTEYWFVKKWLKVKEGNTEAEINDKFLASFSANLPKVLFLYMPIFAFILWLFHDKKKWYYFEHGIFTLHYFSFLMLIILLLYFFEKLHPLMALHPVSEWLHFGLKYLGALWMLYYFFPAHRRFYGDHFFRSFLISLVVFVINAVLITLLMVLYGSYTYLSI